MLARVSTLAWADGLRSLGLVAVLGLTVGCSDSPGPARLLPPPAAPQSPAAGPESAPAPAPTPEAGKVQVGAAMLVGGIDMSREAMDQSGEDFVAVLGANQSTLRRCYGAAAARVPGLRGEPLTPPTEWHAPLAPRGLRLLLAFASRGQEQAGQPPTRRMTRR
jgi:hypothetical protein